MRIPRIYTDQPLAANQTVTLGEGAARHIGRVLRLKQGDAIILFNGLGGEYAAWLTQVERQEVLAQLGAYSDADRESPLQVNLALGISRGERMDYALQKAVELGVSTIQPLFTDRCVVRLDGARLDKRLTHWRGVVISACEQSGRTRLPSLDTARPLERWLHAATGTRLLLDPEADTGAKAIQSVPQEVTLLVGPEGGLSPQEQRQAYEANFSGLRLGPRVLRTETAGVAALAALQTLWGDLGTLTEY